MASTNALISSLSRALRTFCNVTSRESSSRKSCECWKCSYTRALTKAAAIVLAFPSFEQTIWWSNVWMRMVKELFADEQKKYNTVSFVREAFSLARPMMCEQISIVPRPRGADSNSACGVSADFHCVKSMFLVIQKKFGPLMSNGEIANRCLSWSTTDNRRERIFQSIFVRTDQWRQLL